MFTKGFKANAELMKLIGNELDDKNKFFLDRLADAVIQDAQYNLSKNGNIDTGELQASLMKLSETDKFVEVGTELPYAGYIEFGRGPIEAGEGKVLHWINKDGEDVFAKSVKATEPSPYLEPAVVKNTKAFPDIYVNDMDLFISQGLNPDFYVET